MIYRLAIIALVLSFACIACVFSATRAYAHYFGGQTKTVGNYSIVFVPTPDPPLAEQNKTRINFSVLLAGDNIYNIESAVTVKDKNSGNTVIATPFRPYEFSDISMPITFPKPGDYAVTLSTKIPGDTTYSDNPIVADFNVTAFDPKMPVPFDELMLVYVTPAAVVIGGLVVFLHSRGRI